MRATNPSAVVEEVSMPHPSPSRAWVAINQLQVELDDARFQVELDDTGGVIATARTIRRYHQSYMEHMHTLHPFIDENWLDEKIGSFTTAYCIGAWDDMPRGVKRKRSCSTCQGAGMNVGTGRRPVRRKV